MNKLPKYILMTFFCACSNTKEKPLVNENIDVFTQTVDSVFSKVDLNNKKVLAYIVLPNTGCGGCISSAEKLLEEYGKDKIPIRFILTNINSFKAVRNSFGDSIVLSPWVYPDKANLFYKKLPQLDQIYPIIFYTDDQGKPDRLQYIKPDNPNAIEKFRKYIDSCILKKS